MEGVRGKRFRRRLGIAATTLVALAAAASALASQQSAITRSSTFDSSNQGWIVNDFGTGTVSSATWQSTGGNPGGFIEGQLDPLNYGLFQSNVAGWAGNALNDYGGTLAADVADSNDPASDVSIGFFSGNSSVLACEDMGLAGVGWETHAATLDTSHLIDCNTSNPLTGPQASAALAGFRAMFVYISGTGTFVTVGIDNAAHSGPTTAGGHPTGAVTRAFTLAYKARTFQGTLTAPDDYSCAGKVKVSIFRKGKRAAVKTGTTSTPDSHTQGGPAKFSIKLKVGPGTYYAKVKKATSSLDGNSCDAAASKSVRVR